MPANTEDTGSSSGLGKKIPHALKQLSSCTATTEPELYHVSTAMHLSKEYPPLPTARKSPRTATINKNQKGNKEPAQSIDKHKYF